ncbi:MAG: hypothetical protein KGL62_08780 [Bradyrhizobium sp.]|uniref:hypothetical protein n=1 Tax=Bradyrhizobium sp. TaxID=376 RepID=UPI0023863679|nr:hypothetical protein [Bradyrhizobium sp.]MDE2602446.1 hypothetical protein [Bradyrhizobium sp.]
MNNKLLKYLMAGVLGTTLSIASPALAFHGGGGGMGGGAHFGGGGMHFGGVGGAAHFSAMGSGTHFGGMHFNGGHFAATPFAHAGFSPRFSRFSFRDRDHFFHHRFHRFAFVGAPFIYAADYYYDDCWRRVLTRYGWHWTNVCVGYGYY